MGFFRRLVSTLVILCSVSSCASPASGSTDRSPPSDILSPARTQKELARLPLPVKVVDQGKFPFSSDLPRHGILLALSRWGSTTLAIFDFAKTKSLPVTTKATGEMGVSFASGTVAYLQREGVNPANNYVEVLDLKERKSQLIKPAEDVAIMGFSLSHNGDQLTYAQINLRGSRSHRVSWRTGIVDLRRHDSRVLLTSAQNNLPSGTIPVPFAWSGKTDEIYFQALLPFRGMIHEGIWAMRSDGSKLRRILSEPSYAGLPLLSSDGTHLAYLSTRNEALPRNYVAAPGAPPANVLTVINAVTGEQSVFAQQIEAVFGIVAWSRTGKEILVSRQEWLGGRFRDVALRRIQRMLLSNCASSARLRR